MESDPETLRLLTILTIALLVFLNKFLIDPPRVLQRCLSCGVAQTGLFIKTEHSALIEPPRVLQHWLSCGALTVLFQKTEASLLSCSFFSPHFAFIAIEYKFKTHTQLI